MKRVLRSSIYGMANLVPRRTHLNVDIWAQHKGVEGKESHRNTPRIKLSKGNNQMSITIEAHPVIKAKSRNIKKSDMNDFQTGIDYVGRNYDLFLKHYNDVDDEFDDIDLCQALADRGQYYL